MKKNRRRGARAALLALACASCGSDARDPPDASARTPDSAPTPAALDSADTALAADSAGAGMPAVGSAEAAALARFRASVPARVFVRRGACPFECCVYRQWTAESEIPVVTAERARTLPAFTLPAGQQFVADSGNVWITGTMLVAVTDSVADRPYWSFAPGDTLVVLDHIGEGHFNVWHGGRTQEVEGFWLRRPSPAATIGQHRTEWWVHVTLADGRSGWFEASSDVDIAGADACG